MRPRVLVKLCGMTRAEDIALAAELGADAIGLIFYPKSPRAVTLEQAQALVQAVPLFLSVVAVLVNPERDLVLQLVQHLPVDYLQFHGDESPEFCEQFGLPYIKAIAATSTEAIQENARAHPRAVAILVDSSARGVYGGTGQVFDWQMLPNALSQPLVLAGGLSAENVALAIQRANPVAVDACSGVELRPGMKDPNKMRQFMLACQQATYVGNEHND